MVYAVLGVREGSVVVGETYAIRKWGVSLIATLGASKGFHQGKFVFIFYFFKKKAIRTQSL